MASQQLVGGILVLFGLMFAHLCRADQDVWTDLGVAGDAIAYPQFDAAPSHAQPPAAALDQRLNGRFNMTWTPARDFEFGLQYGLEQRWRLYQDDGDVRFADTLEPGGADFRWRDVDSTLIEVDDTVSIHQNLDRLYALVYTDSGSIQVGRQAISFGLAKVFSPVDVILPAGLQARERSYRPGVDALRWRVPLGAVSEVDLGWVAGRDSVLFGRAYTLVSALTLEFTALSVNERHHLVGVGAQTALGQWGLWQETAWLDSDDESGVRATVGVDQQIPGDVYVVGEYHYNGLGRSDDYQNLEAGGFYGLGLVVPWGRHYLSLQASKSLTPLMQGQAGTLVNLGDGSALATARLDWSLSDNSSLDVAVDLPLAESPRLEAEQPAVSDEFGVYPTRISVNWSTVF